MWANTLLNFLGGIPKVSSNFVHAANIGSIPGGAAKITPSVELRVANQEEIALLRKLIPAMCTTSLMNPFTRNPYESEKGRDGKKLRLASLSQERWKYHVLTYRGSNARVHEVAEASILTRKRIVLGPFAMGASGMAGVGGHSESLTRLMSNLDESDDPFLSVTEADIAEWQDLVPKVKAFRQDHPLHVAMKRFEQLDSIPEHSTLRFLGYVSIIEFLITHNPDQKDPTDSLSRQIRGKMHLVSRRAALPFPYEILGGAENQDVWKPLYSYRSAIAHGSTPDFKRDLKMLKDAQTALEFVRCATVSLMRQALEEPDLIDDLKKC